MQVGRNKFVFIFFIFLFGKSFGQQLDSLLNALKNPNDSMYVHTCAEIAEEYFNLRKPVQGFHYLDSAMKRALKTGKPRLIGYVYVNLGNNYNYVNDYNQALDNFDKAEVIYTKINYLTGVASTIINKGNTFFYAHELQKAERNYLMALKIQLTLPEDISTLANIYNNLGSVYGSLERYDDAKKNFLKVIEINKNTKDSFSLAYTYNNLGSMFAQQAKFDEALFYLNKAMELKLKYGSNADKSDAYRNLASVYSKVEFKQYKKALELTQKAWSYIDTNVFNDDLRSTCEGLANLYNLTGNYMASNFYSRKLIGIDKEIFRSEMTDRMQEKEMMADFSKAHLRDSLVQATEIEKQKSEISSNNTIRTILLSTVGIVIVFLIILYRRFKESQAQKNEISKQKQIVDEKQKEILDSIKYAQRIQSSLMPTDKFIDRIIKKNKPS